MKVLVTGAGGQLGIDVVTSLGWNHSVTGLTRADLDVGDAAAVSRRVEALEPEVVVNCAAWTAVDACEDDPERAHRVNAGGPANLVAALDNFGGRLIQISTDYVFDGTKSGPYVEDDEPNPLSVYGASKLDGEQSCRDSDTIVRTSWLMGPHRPNILTTILDLLSGSDDLHFVDDQRGCPTFTGDLAEAINPVVTQGTCGVIHLTNRGVTSWYDLARSIADLAGFDRNRVSPITTDELGLARRALRPANSELGTLKPSGPTLRHHRDALAEVLAIQRPTAPDSTAPQPTTT